MRVIEWLCIAFFVLCGAVELFWVMQHAADLAGWQAPTREEWPAWVQAIGSIAAIAGAFFIGDWQAKATHQNDLKVRQAELNRKNGSILAIADAAHYQAAHVAKNYGGEETIPPRLVLFLIYNEKIIDDIVAALGAVPIHDLGSYEAVAAFMQMKNNFTYLAKFLKRDNELAKNDEESLQARTETCQLVRTNSKLVLRHHSALKEAFRVQRLV